MENTNKQTEQQPDICFAGIENEQETQLANDGIPATFAGRAVSTTPVTLFTINVTMDSTGKYIISDPDKTALYNYLLANGNPEFVQVKYMDDKNTEHTYQCISTDIVDNHDVKRTISGRINFLYSTVSPKEIIGKLMSISVVYRDLGTTVSKSINVFYNEYTTDFYSRALIQKDIDPVTGIVSINLDTMNESGGFAGMVVNGSLVAIGVPNGVVKFTGMTIVPYNEKFQLLFDCVNGDMYTRNTYNNAWLPWKKTAQADKCETIVFTATYTIDPVTSAKTYTMDNGEMKKFFDYVKESKTNPVMLHCTLSGGTSSLQREVYFLDKLTQNGIAYTMDFSGISAEDIHRIRLTLHRIGNDDWSASNKLLYTKLRCEESQYKFDRYYYPEKSFDMNDYTKSGGIAAEIYDGAEGEVSIVGSNIPDGFTDFYGYVLANNGGNKDNCCTQVLTDRVLLKTMMRSSVPGATLKNTWTDWKEIGNGTSVYVVTEYPADLSTYADGSIFIKQQA